MPLRWNARRSLRLSPLAPEPPLVVLAVPGSVGPQQRFTQAVAAGSLLLVGFRPLPNAPVTGPIVVTNTHASGPGSLAQAVLTANANPGPDTVTFQPGLTGTIVLTSQIAISGSVQIIGPGPGALAVSGNNLTRVFYLTATSPLTATISGLTIRDGHTTTALHDSDGAGLLSEGAQVTLDNDWIISNTTPATNGSDGGGVDVEDGHLHLSAALTIRNSLISGNYAEYGGGVAAYYLSSGLTIQNSQILSNTSASNGGGAIISNVVGSTLIEDSTFAGNTSGRHGGGIEFKQYYEGSSLSQVIRRTTISGNSAVRAGGLYLGNVKHPLVVENSTLSGNHASTVGGGLLLYRNANNVILQNTTIAGNSGSTGAGGVEVESSTAAITNTIIAGNVAPLNSDISGTLRLAYDLVQVTGAAVISDAGGNVFGLDPLLGPLADNGGPTHTQLPARTSRAIDAGDPAFAPPPATDQRGRARVVNGRLDIGAVETPIELFLPLTQR